MYAVLVSTRIVQVLKKEETLTSAYTRGCAVKCNSQSLVLAADFNSLKNQVVSAKGMKEERGTYLLPIDL